MAGPVRAGQQRPVVVELFTSQGCSSCPPADRLAAELKAMPGVVMLSLNVDYWDYLGWRDSLASPEFSRRQYDYAKSRGDMDVYTPQMVVDGAAHVVGSKKQAVLAAIEKARSVPAAVAMSCTCTETECAIAVGSGPATQEATIWLLPTVPKIDVAIERGENGGSTITYSNVVRKLVPAGMWHGEAVNLALPRASVMPEGSLGCTVLLQKGKVGPVLGCAAWGQIGA